jgi:repressor LexA
MVSPNSDLTPVQLKIYRAIKRFMEEHGYPPTVGELSESQSRTKASIHAVLNSLIQKGFIRRSVGKARSLEILRMPQATVIDVIAIPRLGSVPAGNPITAEENRAGEVFVEASIVGKDPCFALDVTGSSMIGADILDGDTLIVRLQPLAENGDIVVASVDGEVTVKRLSMMAGVIRLLPENKTFKPIEVSNASDFRILGKVIATRRLVAVAK